MFSFQLVVCVGPSGALAESTSYKKHMLDVLERQETIYRFDVSHFE